ncbi:MULTISPECIES: hypothetical protein [unclassified Enterococcus]|uniref:hypothetical protein n=1 Tax=unclassified Enterococcus TaxID=2608891 RepID=UPI001A9B9994|nr:hypothetical protein [Enterococcus sp. DIV1271a]MBO1299443.1 hypothetical protein [Enterococcus sp. DIV1271a]
MRKITKISLPKFSKSYLYASIFFALIVQGDHTITAADEEILNPLNPSESVAPKNPERMPLPAEETTPSSKEEKAEKQASQTQGEPPKKHESKKKVVQKEDFFHPGEHLVLNKRSKSSAGMGEDARVGKTDTGVMLAALSGKMLFGMGRLDGESYVRKERTDTTSQNESIKTGMMFDETSLF